MKDIDFLKKGIFAYQGIYDNKNVYENTLEAFKVAIKRRNNIYFEVVETKDHKFVVCKNDVFERIHNSKDKVEDMTYDELCYVSFYHIPLLEEVLELINGKVGIMIDPKVHTKHKNLFELSGNLKILFKYYAKIHCKSCHFVILSFSMLGNAKKVL